MKLTKENVYVDLQGKTKEELTDLWEFLDSIGQKQFRDSLNEFLNNYYGWTAYEFSCNYWMFSSSRLLIEKTKVTIERLKEILQPMGTKEFEKLFNYAKSVDFNISDLAGYINHVISFDYYNQLEGDEPEDKAHFFALKYKDIDLSLEQQLQKAEAEVKRLQSLIEEENKPKIGDWVVNIKGMVYKHDGNDLVHKYKKITDQELINKLNELIK